MATLVGAGIPLSDALKALIEQVESRKLEAILRDVREKIVQGATFAEALSHHPSVFNELYVNMVRAGEAGGVLDVILSRLAAFMEKSEQIKAKVKGALAYPIAVLVVAVIVLIVVMTYVIPRFKEIFKRLIGEDLPAMTQRLIDVSDFVALTGGMSSPNTSRIASISRRSPIGVDVACGLT